MRRILRRREIVMDDWIHLGEDAADGAALIVPLAELRKDPQRWWQWSGRLGVRLTPVDRVEELADELPRLDLVAVEFPTPVDGRGYSAGRLLRERLGFRGELRAVGAGVRQDQVFLLARCGFDAIELVDGEDADAARRALQRYDVAYQPGSPETAIRRQRFFA
jgi:phosphoadenosine phosphosulfate reductase